jgi:uncharacterized membrane protein YqjE
MRTPETEPGPNGGSPGVAGSVKQVTEHAKALVALEIELAKLELKGKAAALGMGIGLMVAAAIVGLFAVGFLFATFAAVLATFLPTWLAILIVTLVLAAIAGVLALVGSKSLQRGTPPVPEQAIWEAKQTTAVLKSDVGDR